MSLVKRFYTKDQKTLDEVFDMFEWETTLVELKGKDGIIFSRKCEFPKFWSERARVVTASKYFYSDGEYEEHSLKHMVERVVNKIGEWYIKRYQNTVKINPALGYGSLNQNGEMDTFSCELAYILVSQKAAFNSPVWFNLGVPGREQTVSACFITSVEDDLDSILEFNTIEGKVFKNGSGNGANFSKIRGSNELVKGDGAASGPCSFMKGYDAFAGIIRSGGKLRRAAKMCILDCDHPDIEHFVEMKSHEEKKMKALIDAGFDGGFGGEAMQSVAYQNQNNSVAVTNEFMEAVKENKTFDLINRINDKVFKTVSARELLEKISKAAWTSGDPACVYIDAINNENTIPNSGRIESCNPCATLDSHVLTKKNGFQTLRSLLGSGKFKVLNTNDKIHDTTEAGVFLTQENASVYEVTFSNGLTQKFTGDHKFKLKNGKFKKLLDIKSDEQLDNMYFTCLQNININDSGDPTWENKEEYEKGILTGWFFGDGSFCHNKNRSNTIEFSIGINEFDCEEYLLELIKKYIDKDVKIDPGKKEGTCHRIRIHKKTSLIVAQEIGITEYKELFDISKHTPSFKLGFLRGLATTDGAVRSGGKYVDINSIHKNKLKDFLRVILEFGGYGTMSLHSKQKSYVAKDGKVRNNKNNYKLSTTDIFTKKILRPLNKFKYKKINYNHRNNGGKKLFIRSVEEAGYEDVYDITVPESGEFICGGGCTVHNCGEVWNINDTSCNLSSIKLIDGITHIDFSQIVTVMMIAQDCMIDYADYPHPKIAEGTKNTRNIGIGVTNLGAYLMEQGIPYDSDHGREVAASIMTLVNAQAILTSYKIAEMVGAFPFYKENQNEMWHVIENHAIMTEELDGDIFPFALEAQAIYEHLFGMCSMDIGFANCFLTAIAPCGTISFMMDAETTGCEPANGLVVNKKLVGGGALEAVSDAAEKYLRSNYKNDYVDIILEYIKLNGSPVGLDHFTELDFDVLACAYGDNTIDYMGHLKMIAALQPHVGQGISKTVAMPNDSTTEDFMDVYIKAWEMGIKCISLYRDGSKNYQPLEIKKKDKEVDEPIVTTNSNETKWISIEQPMNVIRPRERRKPPNDRRAVNHKFEIGDFEGYLTAGFYDDGKLCEVLVRVSQEDSVIGGLLDSFCVLFSLYIQYGCPIDHMIKKLRGSGFPPNGVTSNEKIRIAKSITDYIVRWIEIVKETPFGEAVDKSDPTEVNPPKYIADKMITFESGDFSSEDEDLGTFASSADNNGHMMCPNCQDMTPHTRSGPCHYCDNCGESSGCS